MATTRKPATRKAPSPPAVAAAPAPRVRKRSGGMEGTVWTDEDYAAKGYRRLSLRLSPVPAAHLTELERELGASPTEVIRQALEELHRARVKGRKRGGE